MRSAGAVLRAAVLAVAGGLLVQLVAGSANGLLYVCDTTQLTSTSQCYFVASNTNTVGASMHSINRCIAADGYRKVQNSASADLGVTPQPWTQGDKLVASSTAVTGDSLAYAKAFEMVAPLRDMMMYNPSALTSATEWAKWTKAFKDCKIKDSDEVVGNPPVTGLSRDNVWASLKSTSTDNHHYILQFLEEGAIDLVCLMTSLSMTRCDTIRATMGVTTTSTCMDAAYTALYGTSTCTSSSSSDDDGFPTYGIALCVVLPLVAIGGIVAAVFLIKGSGGGATAAPDAEGKSNPPM